MVFRKLDGAFLGLAVVHFCIFCLMILGRFSHFEMLSLQKLGETFFSLE